MYTIYKKFLLKLGSTLDPLASRSVDVPLVVDDVVQNLAVWVYQPGGALGGGSLQLFRNSQSLSNTAFAGNFIVVPVNLYTVGADFEMELLNPPTTSRQTMSAVWRYDPVAGAMIEDKDLAKFDKGPRDMTMSMKVTNTDAAKKDLVLMWMANVMRSNM